MILPVLNLLLIVAIAGVGISGFFLPGKGILARKPATPAEEQEFAGKRTRAILIMAGVTGVLVVILLYLLGSGALTGAAGSPAAPESDYALDTTTVIAAALGVMLLGAVGIGMLLAVALGIFIMLKAPTRVRKIIGFSAAILTGLLVLSVASYAFNWGWNFPDIFGTVGGVLSLVFLINDRYLSKEK